MSYYIYDDTKRTTKNAGTERDDLFPNGWIMDVEQEWCTMANIIWYTFLSPGRQWQRYLFSCSICIRICHQPRNKNHVVQCLGWWVRSPCEDICVTILATGYRTMPMSWMLLSMWLVHVNIINGSRSICFFLPNDSLNVTHPRFMHSPWQTNTSS